ncbi:hypothetical protein ACH4U5_39415 [Streptomyces sp. NPDC020858]|uniref:hypothetical protein n=1 Tax=Streptomyces sp. NPDC020858 TaxID=3365097 RepID=UPI00379328E1
MSQTLPRFVTEPDQVIAEAVLAVEPELTASAVEELARATIGRRPERVKLAEILATEPNTLTAARPQGPRTIEYLIRALIAHGATRVRVPRCAGCGADKPLPNHDGELRICRNCASRNRRARRCAVCGAAHASSTDRLGKPRCRKHPPHDGRDVLGEVCGHVMSLAVGLSRATIEEAVMAAVPQSSGRLRLLWSLDDTPGLLTRHAVKGPAGTLRLMKELIDRGASGLSAPSCPFCHRTKPLPARRDGLSCCVMCHRAVLHEPCSVCNRSAFVAARAFDGKPMCFTCRQADPLNHAACSRCGTVAAVVARTAKGPLCGRCRQSPTATCATCGRTKPCFYVRTGQPMCRSCHHKIQPTEPCSRCGQPKPVNYRTPAGAPLCKRCGEPRFVCGGCGRSHRLHGRTPEGAPLCKLCWAKHPASRMPCTNCSSVETPFHHRLCPRCSAHRALTKTLAAGDGRIPGALEPVFEALITTLPPHIVMQWLAADRPSRTILDRLAEDAGPVTHDTLDRLEHQMHSVAVRTVRSTLVVGGALPARDEELADLEKWLNRTYPRVSDPDQRKVLRSFTTWHHLRRLRRPGTHISKNQADGVKGQTRHVVRLLEWLQQERIPLAECTQDHVDLWLASGSAQRALVRHFLHWAGRRGHTRPLTAPTYFGGYTSPGITHDERWRLVGRLVNDNSLELADRVAGLLVLLLAQPPHRIVTIAVGQVIDRGDALALPLGTTPIDLPPPLDSPPGPTAVNSSDR